MTLEERLREHRDKLLLTLMQCRDRVLLKPEAELHAFMREQNKALIAFLEEENRWLAVLAGEKVEPKQVEVQAVMLPAFGGGGL